MKKHKHLTSAVLAGLMAVTSVFGGTSVSAFAEEPEYSHYLFTGDVAEIQEIELSETELSVEEEAVTEHRLKTDGNNYTAFLNKLLDYKWGYQDLGNRDKGAAKQAYYNELMEASIQTWNSSDNFEIMYTNSGDKLNVAFTCIYTDNGLSYEEAKEAYYMFLNDNPWVYYIFNRIGTIDYTNGASGIMFVSEDEYAVGSDRARLQDAIVSYVENACAAIATETSPYRKTVYLHDKLVKELEYSVEIDAATGAIKPSDKYYDHNILGGIVNNHGVCETYAKLFRLLLNYSGVDNVYVTGLGGTDDGKGGMEWDGHAWNLVKMDDGNYYWFDSTWDDPYLGGYTPTDKEWEKIRREYFAIGQTQFQKDHNPFKYADGELHGYNQLPSVPADNYVHNNELTIDDYKKYNETHSMTLRDDIGVNFFVDFEQKPSSVVMTAWLDENDKKEIRGELQTDGRYKFTYYVSIPEMADSIHYTYTASFGGLQIKTDENKYSVRDYCKTVLSDSDDDDLKNLAAQTLNCGAYAQIVFNHNTGDLANSILSQYGYSTDIDPTAIDNTAVTKTTSVRGQHLGEITSASLIFNTNISLKIYVKLNEGVTENDVFMAYKLSSANNYFKTDLIKDGDRYYVLINGIYGPDLLNVYDFVLAQEEDGSTYMVSDIKSYSPACYATSMYNKNNVSKEVKDAVCSLMMYCKAAVTYFSKHP